ncbi:MAG TPA: tetratricopeptide repeat protein [Limnochorda sp.]
MSPHGLQDALLLRSQGHLEEALEVLRALRAGAPDDPVLALHTAMTHDSLGHESEAIPLYEEALAKGLAGEERRAALLGLGSSYRCVGQLEASERVLRQAMGEFPEAAEFPAFLALTLYDQGRSGEAVQLLMATLLDTTEDPGLKRYEQALRAYASGLAEPSSHQERL